MLFRSISMIKTGTSTNEIWATSLSLIGLFAWRKINGDLPSKYDPSATVSRPILASGTRTIFIMSSEIIVFLPIFCMIYEEIVLFSPFIFAVLILKNKSTTFKSTFKLSLLFLPSLALILYFFMYPLSMENHKIMADSLMNVFNETCYMSCYLVVGNDITSFSDMVNYI